MTDAVLKNANDTVAATYAYGYDERDNLTSKTAPFADDFNDGGYSGWSVWGGSWSASNYYLESTGGSTDRIVETFTDADYETSFRYRRDESASKMTVYLRAGGSGGGSLWLQFAAGYMRLYDTGSGTQLGYSGSHGSTEDEWYDVRAVVDGSDIEVWRGEDGGCFKQHSGIADTSGFLSPAAGRGVR